jgi:PIN like domain
VCSAIEEFGRGAADEVWIPGIASRHGIAITQDVNIRRTRAQWELCQENKIGVFFFKPPKKEGWSYWQIVELVIRHWPEIKRLTEESRRPFGCVVEMHRSKIRRL